MEAGLRPGALAADQLEGLADAVASRASIAHLLDHVDEVHTLTSLTGFEALLKGLPVSVYGLPFYAGWGLTEDLERCARRTRRLGLDELVAGTLILYPRYVHRPSGWPCNPEDVVRQLSFSLLRADTVGLLQKHRARPLLRRVWSWNRRPSGG